MQVYIVKALESTASLLVIDSGGIHRWLRGGWWIGCEFIGEELAPHRHRQMLKIQRPDTVIDKADLEKKGSVIAVEEKIGWGH